VGKVDPDACGRLKAARAAANLSVRELSRRVGISASMLSQIENGRAQPSVATLYALVSTLSLSLDELLSGNAVRSGRPDTPVVTPANRALLVMETGVTWERLTPGPDPLVDALLVTYPPGSSSTSGGGLMRHTGHEYGFLLSGRLTVHLGFENFVLEPGSAISFDSATPHAYVNEGTEAAQGIWHVIGRNHVKSDVPSPPREFTSRRESSSAAGGADIAVDGADPTGVK
jgi:transcriptional regulator with XRE-family HTH domain/mannose-6-phosphate isomerase-like protein (cupin superfamily)